MAFTARAIAFTHPVTTNPIATSAPGHIDDPLTRVGALDRSSMVSDSTCIPNERSRLYRDVTALGRSGGWKRSAPPLRKALTASGERD